MPQVARLTGPVPSDVRVIGDRVTTVGTRRSRPVASPISPSEPWPQHTVCPSVLTAHVWVEPVTICFAVRPVTSTGVSAFVVVLLPSCPRPFAPQQRTLPSTRRLHAWVPPPDTACAGPGSPLKTGDRRLVV